jgi:ABC-2 type transport system permease protein
MSKIGLIIKREYTTRIRKKSFIIMTILGPLLFAGLLFGTIWITLNDQETYTVLISDPYGLVLNTAENKTRHWFQDFQISSKTMKT